MIRNGTKRNEAAQIAKLLLVWSLKVMSKLMGKRSDIKEEY